MPPDLRQIGSQGIAFALGRWTIRGGFDLRDQIGGETGHAARMPSRCRGRGQKLTPGVGSLQSGRHEDPGPALAIPVTQGRTGLVRATIHVDPVIGGTKPRPPVQHIIGRRGGGKSHQGKQGKTLTHGRQLAARTLTKLQNPR